MRCWKAQGRNGYTGVDEYEVPDGTDCMEAMHTHVPGESLIRGPVFTGTRKEAESVAYYLNAAYRAGRADASPSPGEMAYYLNAAHHDASPSPEEDR